MIRTRLAVRSTATILSLMAILGLIVLSISVRFVFQTEGERQRGQLAELIDTVQSTLAVAAFLSDVELAREVSEGLAANDAVAAVLIIAEGEVLARSGPPGGLVPGNEKAETSATPLRREIISPFDAHYVVGEIFLMPNQQVIDARVRAASIYTAVMLLSQMVLIGAIAAWVVVRLITRPISRISNRLHNLQAETGEKLELPEGNEQDEIGQLVTDVNAMIDHLVRTLDEERQLRLEREREEKKFRAIFENAETALFLADDSGTLHSYNPAFLRHFALAAVVEDNERLPLDSLVQPSPRMLQGWIEQCLADNRNVRGELEIGHAPDSRWLQVTLSPLDSQQVQGVANDITDRKLAELAAEKRAMTDPLTGIGNRAGFENRLSQMIAQSRGSQRSFALFMLDLDHFKDVNDSHGHQAGDRVLVAVAQVLTGTARKSDYSARLGGDEFVLLMEDMDSEASVRRIAASLVDVLAQPIVLDEGLVAQVSVSIGVSLFRADDTGAELMRRTDEALYEAKHKGRNQYRMASRSA